VGIQIFAVGETRELVIEEAVELKGFLVHLLVWAVVEVVGIFHVAAFAALAVDENFVPNLDIVFLVFPTMAVFVNRAFELYSHDRFPHWYKSIVSL